MYYPLNGYVAYSLKTHIGEVNHEFLDWFLPIERDEGASGRDPRRLQALEAFQRLSPTQLAHLNPNQLTGGISLTLMTYSLPLIEAGLLPELVLLPLRVRQEVLAIREQLGFINQEVPRLTALHERTFDASLTTANRALVNRELEIGYRKMAERAQGIAERVRLLIHGQ